MWNAESVKKLDSGVKKLDTQGNGLKAYSTENRAVIFLARYLLHYIINEKQQLINNN
jgi:hypothetical protein